ncbi:MAG: hypothetical protein HKN87_10580 [Saprospiraceae bacterium]|nr:hypothetical protein [Saprospiraceae bacterium]
MKKIDVYSQFRKQARDLRIEPTDRVWDRLESRLEQDKGKVKFSVVKLWIAIAASMLVLLTSIFYLFTSEPTATFANLEELQDVTARPSFAVYHQVNDVNAAYQRGNWQQINEGSNPRLKQHRGLKILESAAQGDTL